MSVIQIIRSMAIVSSDQWPDEIVDQVLIDQGIDLEDLRQEGERHVAELDKVEM